MGFGKSRWFPEMMRASEAVSSGRRVTSRLPWSVNLKSWEESSSPAFLR